MKKYNIAMISIIMVVMTTVFMPGFETDVSAYSTHSDCDSQYAPDLWFWQRSPQREAQYEICKNSIDGKWGDLSDYTGYGKCSREAYKLSGDLGLAYDYEAILKSCMYGIYGEELSDDPEERDVLDDVDDQVEDETITRGPSWSEYNLENYCDGYRIDKEAGALKEEYECIKDNNIYRLYLYKGNYYAEYISRKALDATCEDSFFLGALVCKAAELVNDSVDFIANELILPMLKWRVLV